jgi:hypothetical protein
MPRWSICRILHGNHKIGNTCVFQNKVNECIRQPIKQPWLISINPFFLNGASPPDISVFTWHNNQLVKRGLPNGRKQTEDNQ